MEQIALFDAESDGALFLPPDVVAKRYTAAQVRALEAKRGLILLCVSAGVPVTDIATHAAVSVRTVQALAGRDAQKVASDKKAFGAGLHALGGRWFGLAVLKEGEASALQLAMMGSMAVQRGNEVLLTAEVEGEKIVDIETGSAVDARDRVRRFLESKGLARPVLNDVSDCNATG
jgi:hypothetical protein